MSDSNDQQSRPAHDEQREQHTRLVNELTRLTEQLDALIVDYRGTAAKVDYLCRFLDAVRREVRTSLPVRLLRFLLGGRHDASPPEAEGAAGGGEKWHEDFVRVYPESQCFDLAGQRRQTTEADRRNYLNHVKFYRFAAQFAAGRRVLDAGCGSGYGAAMLAEAGAVRVCGCDLSDHALYYARRQYGRRAEFAKLSVTHMHRFADAAFDLVICSEVLEHLTAEGQADAALAELRRVAAPGALLILATPNLELLDDHGFAYADLAALCGRHFGECVIFENALLPLSPAARRQWEARRAAGQVGTIVAERLCLGETALPDGFIVPSDPAALVKPGIPPGDFSFGETVVDTALLHNTHSFVVLARTAQRNP